MVVGACSIHHESASVDKVGSRLCLCWPWEFETVVSVMMPPAILAQG